jgi:hypothetical protein
MVIGEWGESIHWYWWMVDAPILVDSALPNV